MRWQLRVALEVDTFFYIVIISMQPFFVQNTCTYMFLKIWLPSSLRLELMHEKGRFVSLPVVERLPFAVAVTPEKKFIHSRRRL